MDLLNRYHHGEFTNRDSIKLDNLPLFHTLSGRPVYGNDGVLADVFVPRDTAGVNSYYLRVAGSLMREYSFVYTEKNRDTLKKYKTWQELNNYLSTQPLVENLVEYAFSKGIARRPYLIEDSRKLLETQMKAFILRNLFGEEPFYQVFQEDDPIIKTAVKLLKANKATPEAIKMKLYDAVSQNKRPGVPDFLFRPLA
jgi:carboxyl-terminal processing protease